MIVEWKTGLRPCLPFILFRNGTGHSLTSLSGFSNDECNAQRFPHRITSTVQSKAFAEVGVANPRRHSGWPRSLLLLPTTELIVNHPLLSDA